MAADIVLNANAVGEVISYVAPGFLFYRGYRLHYPAPDRPAGEVLIISVVASLPLVALVNLLPGAQKPTQVLYVALLLALALTVGYLSALARGTPWAKDRLSNLRYRTVPEGSIYAQTLYHLPKDAPVTVEFKDGRRVSGCARNGPQHKDDGINELYVVYPEAFDEDSDKFVGIGGEGIIVPLAEVANIVLSKDPTGAPMVAGAEQTETDTQALPPSDDGGTQTA